MQYTIDNTPVELGEKYVLAKQFGQTLLDNCREMIGQAPMYKDGESRFLSFSLHSELTLSICLQSPSLPLPRPLSPQRETFSPRKFNDLVSLVSRNTSQRWLLVQRSPSLASTYVSPPFSRCDPIAVADSSFRLIQLDKVQDQIEKLYKLVKLQPQISKTHMQSIKSLYAEVVRGLGKDVAPKPQKTAARTRRPSSQFLRPSAVPEPTSLAEDKIPLLHLKRKIGNDWSYSSKLTSLYLDILKEIATSGVTFEHKNALMTGVGKGSIGIEIVKGLLAGGARVVITTSRYSRST